MYPPPPPPPLREERPPTPPPAVEEPTLRERLDRFGREPAAAEEPTLREKRPPTPPPAVEEPTLRDAGPTIRPPAPKERKTDRPAGKEPVESAAPPDDDREAYPHRGESAEPGETVAGRVAAKAQTTEFEACPICQEGQIGQRTALRSGKPEFFCDKCRAVFVPNYAFLGLVQVADEFKYTYLPPGHSRLADKILGKIMSRSDILALADKTGSDRKPRQKRTPSAPSPADKPAGKPGEDKQEETTQEEEADQQKSEKLQDEINRLTLEVKMVEIEMSQIQVDRELKELASTRDAGRSLSDAEAQEKAQRLRSLQEKKNTLESRVAAKEEELAVLQESLEESDD